MSLFSYSSYPSSYLRGASAGLVPTYLSHYQLPHHHHVHQPHYYADPFFHDEMMDFSPWQEPVYRPRLTYQRPASIYALQPRRVRYQPTSSVFDDVFNQDWPALLESGLGETGLVSLDNVQFDVNSNADSSTLTAKLPQGVTQDNVQVKVSGNNLRVRIEQHAQRSQRRPEEEKKYPEGAQQTQGNNEQQQSIDTAQRDAAVQSQPYYESSSYQMLERSFLLPGDADVSRLTSEVNDGVLTIKVPRRLQQALQNKAQSNVQAQSIATGTAPSGATVQEPHFTVESEPITKG